MRTVFVLLSFALIAASAAEEDSCTASLDGCANSEAAASSVSLMQKGMRIAVEHRASEPQQLSEIATSFLEERKKKKEFFENVIKSSGASDAAVDAHSQFEDFLTGNDRAYHDTNVPNIAEYLKRLLIFTENLKEIKARNEHEKAHNTHPNKAVHGITQYGDWSKDEFKALLGKKSREEMADKGFPTKHMEGIGNITSLLEKSGEKASCTNNWASRTSIRNQGSCGSCWTFATATTLRAAYIQQHGVDPGKLSTQFLVDCMDPSATCSDGVAGCCGGDAAAAMEWIAQQGGIPTQEEYGNVFAASSTFLDVGADASRLQGGPVSHTGEGITYSGNNPMTRYSCKKNIPKAVTMTAAPRKVASEQDMAKYICHTGAMAVAVDATQWQHYVRGVLQASSCGTSLDHAVTLIGMNEADNAWIIQNSWGPGYGVAVDGSVPPKNKYSNCAALAQGNGCHDPSNAWIANACALSCSNAGPPNGGYIFLEYGSNTCGVAKEAYAATSTVSAGGGAPPSSADRSTCVSGSGQGNCMMTSFNCGSAVKYDFKCDNGIMKMSMPNDYSYDFSYDCQVCSSIQVM